MVTVSLEISTCLDRHIISFSPPVGGDVIKHYSALCRSNVMSASMRLLASVTDRVSVLSEEVKEHSETLSS